MSNHLSPISGIAASDNYIATAGYDNRVILWDKRTKEFLARGYHDHLANYVVFSPDGKYLLSTSSDYTARLWSVPELKLATVFYEHQDDVESASFSACGQYIATASRDHKIRVFSISGELIRVYAGHSADVLSVVWTQGDRELLSTGDDGTIRIWNVLGGVEKAVIHSEEIETDTCAVFEHWAYTGNDVGVISLIDIVTGQVLTTITAHGAGIKAIKIHPQFKLLVSASYDRMIKVWEINEDSGMLKLLKEVSCPSSVWLRAVAIIDDKTLAFGTFGSCYALYNLASEHWDLTEIGITGGKNAVLAVGNDIYDVGDSGNVFFNGKHKASMGSLCNFLLQIEELVITGGQTGEIFNANTSEVVYQHHSPINCGTTYKSNGNTFAIIGTYTGEGLVFQYQNNSITLIEMVRLHQNAIKGIAANEKFIFSVCANTAITFHQIETLELISYKKNAHELIANGADHAGADGFVSVSRDKKLRIWRSVNDYEIIDSPHTHSIKCIKVSPENQEMIATGSYTGLFALYHIGEKKWVHIKKLTAHGISSISYSLTEHCFFASSYDGNIYKIKYDHNHNFWK